MVNDSVFQIKFDGPPNKVYNIYYKKGYTVSEEFKDQSRNKFAVALLMKDAYIQELFDHINKLETTLRKNGLPVPQSPPKLVYENGNKLPIE